MKLKWIDILKLICIICILVITLMVVGCTPVDTNDEYWSGYYEWYDPEIVNFEFVKEDEYGTTLVDTTTGVLYYMGKGKYTSSSSGIGVSPIYNADGTLKLYE